MLRCGDAPVRVLVVDDEAGMTNVLARLFRQQKMETATAGSAAEAERVVAAFDPDILVVDIYMPGGDGLAFGRRLKAAEPWRRIIYMTACTASHGVNDAIENGGEALVFKGADFADRLFEAVDAARRNFERWRNILETTLRDEFPALARDRRGDRGLSAEELFRLAETSARSSERLLPRFAMPAANAAPSDVTPM